MAKVAVQEPNRELYSSLLAAAIDGRARNARYRQHQLYFLHDFLRRNSGKIQAAILKDTSCPQAEVDIELGTSLSVVRKLYDQINFEKSIKDEFLIARNKDNTERRIPYGVVLIRPTLHSRFFSIISATAAAFAAGNVVLLELEYSLRSVDAFFRTEFKVFDGDAFAIATSQVNDADLLGRCLVVDQTASAITVLDSLPHYHDHMAIAVVDRTANIAIAARAIVASKRRFRGTSPYGVDLVVVNEWIKDDFLQKCKEVINSEVGTLEIPDRDRSEGSRAQDKTKAPDSGGKCLLDSYGVIVSEFASNELALRKKAPRRVIRLVATSGLVDATTVVSGLGSLLALYCFSNPHEAKYLGQFIDSNICMVNQIPISLLLGPCAPVTSHMSNIDMRYNTEMMSKPAPQWVSDLSHSLTRNAQTFCDHAASPLRPIKQHSGFAIGFFDRGAILGGVTIVIPSFCLMVYGGYWALSRGYRQILAWW